jgi:hypothetical protein
MSFESERNWMYRWTSKPLLWCGSQFRCNTTGLCCSIVRAALEMWQCRRISDRFDVRLQPIMNQRWIIQMAYVASVMGKTHFLHFDKPTYEPSKAGESSIKLKLFITPQTKKPHTDNLSTHLYTHVFFNLLFRGDSICSGGGGGALPSHAPDAFGLPRFSRACYYIFQHILTLVIKIIYIYYLYIQAYI